MSKVIRLGHTDLKSLFSAFEESLMNNILMQNRINIKRAGDGFSCFITSFKDYRTILK